MTRPDPSPPRVASREQRRQQLIDATIQCLASRGFAQTTLSAVARLAGLSHGLVNFHFQTKDQLLTETLLYLAEEYRDNWSSALAMAPAAPAAQLNALILADFAPRVCDLDRLRAWSSFWGEAQSRPVYQETCGANDQDYIRVMEEICTRLAAEGGYAPDPARAARIIRVTVEGVWLDIQSMKTPYTGAEALRTVFLCASALFPQHFGTDGLLG